MCGWYNCDDGAIISEKIHTDPDFGIFLKSKLCVPSLSFPEEVSRCWDWGGQVVSQASAGRLVSSNPHNPPRLLCRYFPPLPGPYLTQWSKAGNSSQNCKDTTLSWLKTFMEKHKLWQPCLLHNETPMPSWFPIISKFCTTNPRPPRCPFQHHLSASTNAPW